MWVPARRGVFFLGALLIGAAVFNVHYFPAPDWYRDPVQFGAWVAVIELMVLVVALEIVARFVRRPRAPLHLFVFAIFGALVPTFYLCFGAWFGREQAKLDTWHLIGIFTVMKFLGALVFAAMISALLAISGYVRSRLRAQGTA
jgi:hypothetical protein